MSAPATAQGSERCPVCGGGLAVGGWCARCAFADVLAEDTANGGAQGGLFAVTGHVVMSELGRGAAGIVYRARQEQPAREVALKILRPHEAGSAESRARFRLEATTVAKLDHPAILPVLSVGEHDGLPYFTMKLCTGGSLAERIVRYRGAWRESATLVATLADAVQHAHARGVLHRDLKPGNILFDEAERPFVSDFGIARIVGDAENAERLTQPLSIMGTRGYLAPEVLRTGAGAATVAADVYGLGAILHELLTGTELAENLNGTGAATTLKGVPRDLAVIMGKCLQAEPERRYSTAGVLAEDLRAWLAGRPIAARRMSSSARFLLWAQRNPALTAVALGLVITLAGGTVALAWKNRELGAAFVQSQASLADALVAQARAVRQSGKDGQRREALELLARAGQITASAAARDEAVAALALPDWAPSQQRQPWTGTAGFAVPSPDFSLVLVDAGEGNFTLRETETGAERWAWRGPKAAASLPVFSADGRWVALRLYDDTVNVLAVADGRLALRLEGRPYAFKGAVRGYGQDMDFSPDGARLAVTRPSGGVTFHRLSDGGMDGEWVADEWVTAIAFSPDGTLLAAGGGKETKDNVLAVIDACSGKTIVQQKLARRGEFIAWSPDGRWLATRVGGLAEVRAARDLAVRAVLPDRGALHARFLADGRRLLLSEQVGVTRLWEIDQGRALLTKNDAGRPGTWYAGEPAIQWRSYRAGPVWLTTLSDSPVLRSANAVEGGTTVQPMGGPVAVSSGGRWLAVGTWSGGVVLDVMGGQTRRALRFGHARESGTVRLDEAGGAAWVALTEGGLWRHPLMRDAKGEWGTPDVGEQVDAEAGFYCADLNATSGRLALVRPKDGTVKIVDVRTRATVGRWTHIGATSAAFAPDGAQLVVNAQRPHGAPAAVYDVLTGAVVAALGEVAGDHAAWSADGRWIYAGVNRSKGAIWSTRNWRRGPEVMTDANDTVDVGAFSADGRWLALVDSNKDVRLVETATGRILVRLASPEPIGWISGLTFAGEGRLCAVSLEGRVHTWDLTTLRRELRLVGLDWTEPAVR